MVKLRAFLIGDRVRKRAQYFEPARQTLTLPTPSALPTAFVEANRYSTAVVGLPAAWRALSQAAWAAWAASMMRSGTWRNRPCPTHLVTLLIPPIGRLGRCLLLLTLTSKL